MDEERDLALEASKLSRRQVVLAGAAFGATLSFAYTVGPIARALASEADLSGGPATFANQDELRKIVGGLLAKLSDLKCLTPDRGEPNSIVRLQLSDPSDSFDLELSRERPMNTTFGPNTNSPIATLSISGDILNLVLLGRVTIAKALGQLGATIDGAGSELRPLASLLPFTPTPYEDLLREHSKLTLLNAKGPAEPSLEYLDEQALLDVVKGSTYAGFTL